MEANTVLRLGSLAALSSTRRSTQQKPFRANMAGKPKPSVAATVVKPKKEMEQTVYHDNWFDRLAIARLSRSIQSTSGMRNNKEGYESLVEAAMVASKNFDAKEQQELVIRSLKKTFPPPILTMIKILLPPSKFARELFAAFTTVFFSWLIGRCEVRTSEDQGKTEHNVVYIPRCRFFESTRCIGMCTSMCKIPCQSFIEDSLGIPVNMVPNFEDMSCEIIFGQKPPIDDPALKQPCYRKLCLAKQEKGVDCSSVDQRSNI